MENTFDYSTLKEGDKVLVQYFGTMCAPDKIAVVTKVTKTQIEIDKDARYFRENGRAYKADRGWSGSHIYELTPEKEAKVYHEKLARWVSHYAHQTTFNKFSDEDLITLKTMLHKYEVK